MPTSHLIQWSGLAAMLAGARMLNRPDRPDLVDLPWDLRPPWFAWLCGTTSAGSRREPAPPPGGARSGRSSARPSRRWPTGSNRARPSPPPMRFRPCGSAQDVVKGELSPRHKTHACDERPKDPQAHYKARQEYRSPPVPLEKPLGASQALGRDKGVPTPPQYKRAPAEAADTIAYLSSHNGSEAAQHHCFP